MGALRDQINSRLTDLKSELEQGENNITSFRARLQAQIEALEEAQGLINDRLEAQVGVLQKLGLLGPIKGK